MQDIWLRVALWEVHRRLCAYCGEPVSFAEIQADHIIPAVLRSDKVERERVLGSLDLPLTADLDAPWNRLPSHGRCNRRKSDDLLNDSSLRYFLELAAKAEPKITKETARLQEHAQTDRVGAALEPVMDLPRDE